MLLKRQPLRIYFINNAKVNFLIQFLLLSIS